MRASLFIAMTALGIVATAPTLAQDRPTTTVRDGDAAMTCQQMADEAAELSAEMGDSGGGLLGRVRTVAEAGAAILVPGAGLAMAGADALTTSGAERREAVAGTNRDRWNYLNGLYAGRGCNAPATAVAQGAAPAPGAPAPAIVVGVLPH